MEAILRRMWLLHQSLFFLGYDLDFNSNEIDGKPWSIGPLGPWDPEENPSILFEAETFEELEAWVNKNIMK